jgi:phosphatidylglycerophosphatase A
MIRIEHIMPLPPKKAQGLKPFLAQSIATAGGAGLLPFAPGTWGSLVAFPIMALIYHWPVEAKWALWGLVTALGVWAAAEWDFFQGTSDNQSIVIDEVSGQWLTAFFLIPTWKNWLLAFILFRILDVVKIPPCRQMDRWSKRIAKAKGGKIGAFWSGFGVMADDLLAALQGLLVLWGLQRGGLLP